MGENVKECCAQLDRDPFVREAWRSAALSQAFSRELAHQLYSEHIGSNMLVELLYAKETVADFDQYR